MVPPHMQSRLNAKVEDLWETLRSEGIDVELSRMHTSFARGADPLAITSAMLDLAVARIPGRAAWVWNELESLSVVSARLMRFSALPTLTRNRFSYRTVLLIEDNEDSAEFVSVYVKNFLGYDVVSARTGLEGLEVLTRLRGRIKVVLLDVMLPDTDGFELARMIPDFAKHPIAIVYCTARSSTEDKVRGLNAAEYGSIIASYLVKPVEIPDMAATLKCAMRVAEMLDFTYRRWPRAE